MQVRWERQNLKHNRQANQAAGPPSVRLPTKEPHGARRQEASGRGPDRTKPPTDPNQVSRPQHRPRNQQPSTRSATGPETNSLGSKEAINNNQLQKRKCSELITESQGPSHTTPNRPKSKNTPGRREQRPPQAWYVAEQTTSHVARGTARTPAPRDDESGRGQSLSPPQTLHHP